MLSDEQVLEMYNDFVTWYGREIPSMEHEPMRFAAAVRSYRYYKDREKETLLAKNNGV